MVRDDDGARTRRIEGEETPDLFACLSGDLASPLQLCSASRTHYIHLRWLDCIHGTDIAIHGLPVNIKVRHLDESILRLNGVHRQSVDCDAESAMVNGS